ncbi:MAG TPA: hypothetical protein PLL78_09530 [Fimbriimonadaceae bacterium]|nr:hypothetical protein [Fimbriimonadaceae bacterium]HRJ96915.1 hypothetical protein [Fimbriimonadaceae bacterium]
MNANKAREFFSEYYEGKLDRALKQAFERRLESDSDLKADYRQFEIVMLRLGQLKDMPVNVPEDLHEKISSRIDRQLYAAKRSAPGGFLAWWKSAALAGLACAAIVAAVIAIRGGSGDTSQANFVPVAPPARIVDDKGTIRLQFDNPKGAPEKTLVVRDGAGETIIQMTIPGGKPVESPLTNSRPEPVLMTIEIGEQRLLVAIPSRSIVPASSGEGSIEALALAISGRFRVAVQVEVPNSSEKASWEFYGTDAMATKASTNGRSVLLTKISENLYKLHY